MDTVIDTLERHLSHPDMNVDIKRNHRVVQIHSPEYDNTVNADYNSYDNTILSLVDTATSDTVTDHSFDHVFSTRTYIYYIVEDCWDENLSSFKRMVSHASPQHRQLILSIIPPCNVHI